MPDSSRNPFSLPLSRVPASPGLYWLRAPNRPLYVGDALNLRERFSMQFSASKFNFWGISRDSLEISYHPVAQDKAGIVAPNQSIWIGKWKPEGNFSKLALMPAFLSKAS